MRKTRDLGNGPLLWNVWTALVLVCVFSVDCRVINQDFDLDTSAAEPRPVFIAEPPKPVALPLVYNEPQPLSIADHTRKSLRPALSFSYNEKTDDSTGSASTQIEDQKPAAIDYYKYVDSQKAKEKAAAEIANPKLVEPGGLSAESKHFRGHKKAHTELKQHGGDIAGHKTHEAIKNHHGGTNDHSQESSSIEEHSHSSEQGHEGGHKKGDSGHSHENGGAEGHGQGHEGKEGGGDSEGSHSHGHGGHAGGNHGGEFEKGGGKEFHALHHGDHGEKGNKHYEGHHSHEKGAKGHHDKENHAKKYAEKGGHKKEHHHDDGYHAEHHKHHGGKKGSKYDEEGEHNKGHSTKGSHSIHKKEEYEKKTEFFDEDNEGGETEKHGGFSEEGGYKKDGHSKGGHKKGGNHETHYGKESKSEKAGFYKDDQGHNKKAGRDDHDEHKTKYGKKESVGKGTHWGYKESSGDGVGHEGGGHGGNNHGSHSHVTYQVAGEKKNTEPSSEPVADHSHSDHVEHKAVNGPDDSETKESENAQKQTDHPAISLEDINRQLEENNNGDGEVQRSDNESDNESSQAIEIAIVSLEDGTTIPVVKRKRIKKRKISRETIGEPFSLRHYEDFHLPEENSNQFLIVAAE